MEKAKRSALHVESIDGACGYPTIVGGADEALVLANNAIAYILEKHPEQWGNAKFMAKTTLDATKPRNFAVWHWLLRIGLGCLIALAAFGLISIGFLLRVKGVL